MTNKILNQLFSSCKKWKTLVLISMLLTLGVGQMWAYTETTRTVYYAIPSTEVGDYTVKLNANVGDNNTWKQSTMTYQGTYNHGQYFVYKGTFPERYGGVDGMQFQLYNGSTWVSQSEPITSWTTTSTYSGKMYVKDDSWKTFSVDASLTWTVAGSEAILGSDWDISDNSNNMTGPSTYVYTLVKQNVSMTASTEYACKVVESHSWSYAYPASNVTFSVAATGHYDVTFSFNMKTKSLTVSTTRLYAVIYNDNGKTGGSVPATSYHANGATVTVASNSGSLVKTGYTFGGWNTNTSGTGTNYAAGSGQFTMGSSDKNLYAKWTENMSTVSLVASPTGKGTFKVGSSTVTSTTAGVTTTRSVTAVPISGYHFVSWAITGGASISSTTTNPTTVTGGGAGTAATLTATFEADNVYTLTVAAGTGISAVSGTTNNIKAGDNIAISATVATGYTWSTWTKTGAGTLSTYTAGTKNQTVTVGTAGDITLTASATETMRTITITGGTAASTTAGVSTTGSATAAEPAAGKKFTGWTLGTGVTLSGGALTDRTINFTATQNSSVTANYADRASVKLYFAKPSAWTKVYAYAWKDGGTNNTWPGVEMTSYETVGCVDYYYYLYYTEADGIGGDATGSDTWDEVIFDDNNGNQTADLALSNGHYYYKADAAASSGRASALASAWLVKGSFNEWGETDALTPNCSDNTATKTITLTTGAKTFKIYNAVNDQWWRVAGNITATISATTMNNNDGDMTLTPSVAGNYTFTVGSTNSTPTLAITYPTTFTLTYDIGTVKGNNGSITTSPSTTSGSKVLSGNTVTLTGPAAKTGYAWKGWYTNAAGTEGKVTDTNRAITVTMNADKTLYACYTENTYNVTVTKTPSAGGSVTPTSVTAMGQVTGGNITASPNTGYNFTNWTITSGTGYFGSSGTSISTTTANTKFRPTAAATIKATFTAKQYTITLNKNGGTGGTANVKATYNSSSLSTTITNPTKTGYDFNGWHKTNGTGQLIINTSGVLQASTDYTGADGIWTNDGAVNLYAGWTAKRYTVNLDLDEDHYGTIAGKTTSQTVTYNAATTTVPNRPTGAEGYGLDGYYTDHNGVGTKLINGDGTWIASVEGYTDADKKWIHDGDVTLYAYYKMAEIASITVSPAIVAPRETVSATPVYSPAPDGTTRICWEVQYSNGTPLPSQPAFTTEGSTVSFQAPESSATYRIEAKLYTGSTCGGGTLLSTQYATFQVAGSHTVTVQYMCDNMVIKAATEMTGKPLEWSEEFTAPTITGYTFTRWDAGDGVTIKNGDSDPVTTTTNQTIQIKAVYDGTLTAVYSKRRMIYFYNTLNWGSVYVYFYKNDSYWETSGNKRGSGAKTTSTWTNTPYSEGLHGQMLPVSEGSKIYYFDAEAAGVNASYDDIVFTEHNQHNYEFFYQTNAVRRGDYKSSIPLFVPLADQTADVHNQTNYYNNGYWMNYPENTGYTLKIYDNAYATKETGAVREFPFPYSADKKMPLKMDVEFNDAGTHEYWFMVYRNDGTYLGSTYHFKQGYQDEQIITGGNNKNKITTSAPGNYTFTLTYHDNGSGTVNYYIDLDFPIASNDYRIIYNDRVKWSSNTAHNAEWYHPSDIIRQIENGATEPKKDTVSFFISKATGANASMEFQKASVTGEGVITWTEVASGTIDLSSITKTGVYNFILTQSAGSISVEKIEPYTGAYYIRTDCAGSTKWDSYKATDHQMTFSDYTKAHEGYTHYYAHWAERGTNVKFVIANDYSPFVSDTLTKDVDIDFKNMDEYGTLNSEGGSVVPYQDRYSANIRFMYNEQTNKLSRAYLASATDVSKKFLVMRGNSAASTGHIFTEDGKELTDADGGRVAGLDEYEMNFADDQNFIYETVIKANPTALIKLYANYCGISQEFKGDLTDDFDTDHAVEILGGTYAAETKEKMRIVYDFKTNRLVCAWLPSGDITGELDINADVMIIREHQGDAQQIKFTTNESILDEVKTVYGVMRFNRWTLNNKSKEAGHAPLGDPKSPYERALYWISFPFDVNLSDVFGFGTYGEDWIIEYYDGAARAAEGYWIDSPGFWRYVWPAQRATFKLDAGKGYVLALDLDRMKDNNTSFWTNDIEQIELFFPSATEAGSIKETEAIISVAEHACTIDRRTDKTKPDVDKDRTRADSHWNMIGIPSYANYGTTITSNGSTVIEWNDEPYTDDLPFLYEWNMVDDSYTVQSGSTYPFKSMHAYMVQYHGDMYWSLASATPTPSPIVARRAYAQAPQEVEFKLELQQNEQMVDQTFVKLSDKEEVSANFNFDEDLFKEFNNGKANVYTLVESYIPAAGNILPLSEQTTLVPVGVKTNADGDYTFSMPNGTDGVGVTLIDGVTGERTNLALTDYTVSLEKGTYDQRFVLEISPIEHTTTALENSEKTDAPNNVCKKLIDGVLYIIKDGKVFDARGARLQ